MTIKAYSLIKIPFHDVDIMNIAWHGHSMKYFEIARTALMQKIDLDWPVLKENGVAMPVVGMEAQYRRPVHYNDEIWVEARIDEYEYPELSIEYKIFAGQKSIEVLSKGLTRQAYVNLADQTTYFAVPEWINHRFTVADQASREQA